MTTFQSLGVPEHLNQILKKQGLLTATPVQERAIPVIRAGKDVVVQAQTGTGKTLAFVLPILEGIVPNAPGIQALIITPTRELALQITTEVKKLAIAVQANVLSVYGGQDVETQIRKIGNTHIVVCTPGRLLDHLRRGTIQLDRVTQLVFDEADQMLAMGFLQEVEDIIRHIPTRRQTLLFSATMPDAVRNLGSAYMKRPEDIRVKGKQITLEGIKQFVISTTDRGRQQALIRQLEGDRPYLAVVFCRTKIRAKKLAEALLMHGMNVDELHGDLTQMKRERVMARFRDAKLQILVATDVAARGLDVEGVTHIYNYDVPLDAESYIHRIGRTGRAGKQGVAVTFAAPKDRMNLERIERGIHQTLDRRAVDVSDGEVFERASSRSKTTSRSRTGSNAGRIEKKTADRNGSPPSKKYARDTKSARGMKDNRDAKSARGRKDVRDVKNERGTKDAQSKRRVRTMGEHKGRSGRRSGR